MTRRVKTPKNPRRVVSTDYAFSQKPLEERRAIEEARVAARRKRLYILAQSTGHTPEELIARGWVIDVYGD